MDSHEIQIVSYNRQLNQLRRRKVTVPQNLTSYLQLQMGQLKGYQHRPLKRDVYLKDFAKPLITLTETVCTAIILPALHSRNR